MITIDRQHRRNAVDGPTAAALHDAYLRFEADEEARVLVLTGAGGVAFCAGADLKATETFVPRLMSEEGPMGFTRLTPSKPTIAAISGFCLAGGLELALWCDLRITTETSTLGYPERRWGVPLDGRRHAAPASHRRPRPRARPDPDGPDDQRRGGARDGHDHGDRGARGAPRAGARSRRGTRRASHSARCSPIGARRSRGSA